MVLNRLCLDTARPRANPFRVQLFPKPTAQDTDSPHCDDAQATAMNSSFSDMDYR
jgi:hypothetical protein